MRLLAWLVLGSLLTGCAGQKLLESGAARGPVSVERAWDAHRRAMLAFADWRIDGRIAVQKGGEGGNAGLRWVQAGERYDLRIVAPLARGTFLLRGDTQRVTLQSPDGQTYEAAKLEDLMADHLGWALPVAGARYWVRGIPAPDAPVADLRLDDTGRLTDLSQSGWRISVLGYREAEGQTLPAKLFLTANELQIRLVITTWSTELP